MDGSVEKEKGYEWREEWRREITVSGWECGEGKGRRVDGSVEKARANSGWEGV